MLIFGTPVADFTVFVTVAVQPLEASVAVRVYVPATDTVAGSGLFVIPGPFQTRTFPGLLPLSVTAEPEQDNSRGVVALTVGPGLTVILTVSVTEPQGVVIVTEYV